MKVKHGCATQRGEQRDILPTAEHWGTDTVLRFIEFMGRRTTNGRRMDKVVPSREIKQIDRPELGAQSAGAELPGEVARRWRQGRPGRNRFHIQRNEHVLEDCTLPWLSARGELYAPACSPEQEPTCTGTRPARAKSDAEIGWKSPTSGTPRRPLLRNSKRYEHGGRPAPKPRCPAGG